MLKEKYFTLVYSNLRLFPYFTTEGFGQTDRGTRLIVYKIDFECPSIRMQIYLSYTILCWAQSNKDQKNALINLKKINIDVAWDDALYKWILLNTDATNWYSLVAKCLLW